MRRILVASVLSLLLCAPAVAAPDNGQSGYSGPAIGGAGVTTVAQAKRARDDTRCVLEGRVIGALPKHEHYMFEDRTGKIEVSIDDKLFIGRSLTPNQTVRLYGEVEQEVFKATEIDVDRFEILN